MSGKAFFVGDHVALDFLNTIAAPRGETVEFIPDGAAYLAWLADAALLEAEEARALQKKFGKPDLDRLAGEARDLREWFRQVLPASDGAHGPSDEVIARLNRILLDDCAYQQLEKSGVQTLLRARRRFTQARQLLVPVAQKMAELFANTDRALIKRCANPNCTLWFHDKTKAHRRLFCSAAVCGNRAKVAAYRERQRKEK
jgi:predicted RNA-binding Zn ribbon-like protein